MDIKGHYLTSGSNETVGVASPIAAFTDSIDILRACLQIIIYNDTTSRVAVDAGCSCNLVS